MNGLDRNPSAIQAELQGDIPALGAKTPDWHIEPNLPMSNASRGRHGLPFGAAIAQDIADSNSTIGNEVLAAAERDSMAIRRFDAA
ncbi:MAG: hypothetical protein ABIO83_11000 [Ilumatobacteraceae bacterium]